MVLRIVSRKAEEDGMCVGGRVLWLKKAGARCNNNR
jgi:hypothetical protein